jgi:DtxR family Mn-dependent transcriptional regulator
MPDPLTSLLVAAAITLIGVFLFWPERGIFWRWNRARQMTARVYREDALKHILHCEIHGDKPTLKSLAGALDTSESEAARILGDLGALEMLQVEGGDFRLTPAGREDALRIMRAHRLWERYLADETGFQEAEWHGQAHLREHMLTPDQADELSARLGYPTHDPHGDPIPSASGYMVYPESRVPLTAHPLDKPARIVHLEDEPETVYAQLVAEDLHVGQVIRLVEHSPQRVRFWAGADEHILAPVVAANISVVPLPEEVREEQTPGESLATLKPGEQGRVVALSSRIRGVERRRLMDLGVLPGTLIEAEMTSASGDPVAYRIRGALIALRHTQADNIRIARLEEPAS